MKRALASGDTILLAFLAAGPAEDGAVRVSLGRIHGAGDVRKFVFDDSGEGAGDLVEALSVVETPDRRRRGRHGSPQQPLGRAGQRRNGASGHRRRGGRLTLPVAPAMAGAGRRVDPRSSPGRSVPGMVDDDRSRRRERFMRELASRDLYEWFGIPPDAGDDAIREAAERKRRELSTTPMPQKKRSMERAFCDQGEKALLRPDVRREYDSLLKGGSAVGTGAERAAARNVAEREARLTAARERIQHYGADDARMAPGAATLLASPDVRTSCRPSDQPQAGSTRPSRRCAPRGRRAPRAATPVPSRTPSAPISSTRRPAP